jgi:hypothetical protein
MGVLPPSYLYLGDEDRIYNTIAGVTVGRRISAIALHDRHGQRAPYFYAASSDDNDVSLYKIDCKTMECARVSSRVMSGSGNN